MERLTEERGVDALTSAYEAFSMQVGTEPPARLRARATELDRQIVSGSRGAPGPRVQLLRARLEATLANALHIAGAPAVEHGRRALAYARELRGCREIPAGSADGIAAEAYLLLCKEARSTAKRALYFHQGRAAALRALEQDRDNVSANLALASFLLHTPRAFGGSPAKAAPYLEHILARIPSHHGAKALLLKVLAQTGRAERYRALLRDLQRDAPSLAALVQDTPGPVASADRHADE